MLNEKIVGNTEAIRTSAVMAGRFARQRSMGWPRMECDSRGSTTVLNVVRRERR